ncbi:hypothetical protein EB796_024907 [Bugula neritina]|uniref:Uncharacterized protein n=1 Tax=Bugula neritina TaxID=10212 RepID=A0A7J7ITP1_BUGNE|nr:hypothetical protein EB796_024907 [Bugula neritina]
MHLAMKNEQNRLAGRIINTGSDREMQMELARRRLAARRERLLPVCPLTKRILLTKLRKALEELEVQTRTLLDVCKNHTGDSSKEKTELLRQLKRAVLYHLTVTLRATHGDQLQEYTPERIQEVSAAILARVQESQDSEAADVNSLVLSEGDEELERLADAYNMATDNSQYNNIVTTLFSILDDESKWTGKQLQDTIEERFEQEKQTLLDSINSGDGMIQKDGEMVDARAELEKLEAEHAAQKNAFDAQMKKQNEMMMARRKAHRQARFEDTTNFARQLLEESEANKALHATAEQEDKDNQGDLMRERLAKRRAARVMKEEIERQEELERASAKNIFHKPTMAMKRERTVIQISEEHNQKELSKLINEKQHADTHMSKEQQKQEEMIRARREQRKQRQHSEVEAIFTMGERQKTMFERSSTENREKQMNLLRDRIARIQNEKTMTGALSRKSTAFEHLMPDTSAAGASKNEQMNAVAASLQKKYDGKSQGMKEGRSSLDGDDFYRPRERIGTM